MGYLKKYYFMKQLIEFIRRSTQFNGKIEMVKVMPAPTITICMKPYLKQSMAQKYGYNSIKSLLDDPKELSVSKYDLLESMSYSFQKDFKLEVLTYENNTEEFLDLSLGQNNFSQGTVDIKAISTLRHGICYLMQTDYNVSVETITYFGLRMSFDPNLIKTDIPQDFEVYLTSPDGWYGIFLDDWAYFDQTYFTISTELDTMYEWVAVLVPTKLEFKEGHESIENCLLDFVLNLNCSNKCFPVMFNIGKLEPCLTPEDQKCIFDALTLERNELVHCMKPVTTMQYRTQPLMYDWAKSTNTSIQLWLWYDSNRMEMKTEADVMGVPDFIGSVGGSLGLFLGFSLFSYFSLFLDSLFEKITS